MELQRTRLAAKFFFLRIHCNPATRWLAGSPNRGRQTVRSRSSNNSSFHSPNPGDCPTGFDPICGPTNIGGSLRSNSFDSPKNEGIDHETLSLKGVTFPAMHALWSRWAPPLERSKLVTAAYSGSYFGTVISMAVCGLLAENFGWASIFYVSGKSVLIILHQSFYGLLFSSTILHLSSGTFAVLWCIVWFLFVSECPHTDSYISPEELDYISNCLGSTSEAHVISPHTRCLN